MTYEEFAGWIAELKVKYPRHGIRWCGFSGEDAYRMTCPGWEIILAPVSWRERWDALPGPKIPVLTEEAFNEFWHTWTSHMGLTNVAVSAARSLLSDSGR